jgi:hypothetical protein
MVVRNDMSIFKLTFREGVLRSEVGILVAIHFYDFFFIISEFLLPQKGDHMIPCSVELALQKK